jgi:branched-chain amino acid transport system permease protein
MRRASLAFRRLQVSPEAVISAAIVAAVLIVLPMTLKSFDLFTASTGLIFAIVLLGLGVVTGRAGMIILCQLSFMAAGAYVLLWMQAHEPKVSLIIDILLAGVVAAIVGAITGLPALRVRGVNLAVVTLAFAVMLNVVLTVHPFPGSLSALYVSRPSYASSETDFFRFCGIAFILVALLVAALGRSKLGAGWSAVRHSERATAAKGLSVPRSKLTALTLNAFCAGLGGALLIVQLGSTSVESFSPLASLTVFALAIMMGTRYVEGALLGGMFYAFTAKILSLIGISATYGPLFFAFGAVMGLKGGLGAAEVGRAAIRKQAARWRARRQAPEPERETAPETPFAPQLRLLNGNGASADHRDVPALEVRGLSHSYGQVKVLDDVSLEVPEHTVTALIGPNGAGKSTLIDCVSGFIGGYQGSVVLDGTSVDGWSARRRARAGLRRSFQQDRAIPDLTVDAYVRMGLSFAQRRALSAGELEDLLSYFGCPAPRRRISEVDVSSRRLLEAVAAVAARPRVVLLDEPAAGLAVAESAQLARQIAGIPEQFGSSVIVVEHDMDLVAEAASHVVVLDFGKVIAAGTPSEVMSDNDVVGAYLGREFAT